MSTLARPRRLPDNPSVMEGQRRAAEAAELRRGELQLSEHQTGVDARTWRRFVAGKKWPKAIACSRIETHLQLRPGALDRIAHGESTLEQEIQGLDAGEQSAGEQSVVPPQLELIVALVHEARNHYLENMADMGDLKIGKVRDLADQVLRDPSEA